MFEMKANLPGVKVQGKGLLATEGVVSIPLAGREGAAVTVNSHFDESLTWINRRDRQSWWINWSSAAVMG